MPSERRLLLATYINIAAGTAALDAGRGYRARLVARRAADRICIESGPGEQRLADEYFGRQPLRAQGRQRHGQAAPQDRRRKDSLRLRVTGVISPTRRAATSGRCLSRRRARRSRCKSRRRRSPKPSRSSPPMDDGSRTSRPNRARIRKSGCSRFRSLVASSRCR